MWSIVATALTDREAWTIDRGSDGQKNRTKQRHTCDSMLFRTFVWIWTWCKDLSAVLFYMSHMFKFLLAKMWNCAEMWRAQSRIQWMIMFRCHLWFSLEHFWFTDSLGLNLCQTYSCAQAITNEVWSCETCDCDMCPQACDIYFS